MAYSMRDDDSHVRRKTECNELRNPQFETHMNQVDIYDPDGLNLHAKVVVALDDEDFLQLVHILQNTKSGDVFLRGHRLRRTRHMNAMFDKKLNELCWVQEIDEDDHRPSEIQSMTTVSIRQVVARRRVRFTNQKFPALSFRDDGGWAIPPDGDPRRQGLLENIEKNAPLTCRMKFVRIFRNAEARRLNNSSENVVLFLLQRECDAGIDNKISDTHLRYLWRGETDLGGAQVGWEPGEKEFLRQEAISDKGQPCRNSLVVANRQYEAQDVMTRGAVGDILIRDEEAGGLYQKLSGVNDTCFVRSLFDIETGEEFQDPRESKYDLNERITSALRSRPQEGHDSQKFSSQSVTTQLPSASHRSVPSSTTTSASNRYTQGAAASPTKRSNAIPTKPFRRYTFGDCFCGAGGMSRGAVMSGLRVKWGFDFNDLACYTYALNFHSVRVYNEEAHAFATSKANQKVDVCHMSPPCQYFSPAHTQVGRNDDMNTASFFAIGQLLVKALPRVAILEQTSGLLTHMSHEHYFHTCVREFTQHGFSVRWKLINCADFGVPQRRIRLFMIASCPGEPLPPFPQPTHAASPPPNSSLKPHVTINAALSTIPPVWPNHSPATMPRRFPTMNTIRMADERPRGGGLANTITTSGGENTIHPSENRSYTDREMATLQTFPQCHKFGGMDVRRQIGNAVAPVMGAAISSVVVEKMSEYDSIVERG